MKSEAIKVLLIDDDEDDYLLTRELDFEAMQAGAADFLIKNETRAALLEHTLRFIIERRHFEEGSDIVATIIQLAHKLGMELTAEGVETV